MFWVAPPPGVEGLELLEEARGLAEPLLDIRYGSAAHKQAIVRSAIQRGIAGLTVLADHRDGLTDYLLGILPAGSRVILASDEWCRSEMVPLLTEFGERGIVVGVEVDGRDDAEQADRTGADFLVAAGNESYGPVSAKTSLILIQELLQSLDLPLVIRGSLGPQGAAGAMAAGCAGCILDSQLLLLDSSPLSDGLKNILAGFSPSDTTVVGALVDRPYRVLCVDAANEHRALADLERKIFRGDGSAGEKARAFEDALEPVMRQGFSEGAKLLPVGQGLVFAQQFAENGYGIKDVLGAYETAICDSIARVKRSFPLSAGSSLARRHGARYPIVQGPMACITDTPRLAIEVANAGALPFVAASGLSPDETRRLLAESRSALGGRPFGVGIVSFSSPERTEEQIEAVLSEPPAFVTIAGGDPDLARRFEESGIAAYLHAPSLTHVKNALDNHVEGIILEGHEAGGHVGALGSMVLWELGVGEIMTRDKDSVAGTRLLLAGGIADARGALVAATLASPVVEQGLDLGLQIGTAYLMTDEAVESGVVPEQFREALLDGDETAIVGRTVNLPGRWLATPAVRGMIETELQLEEQGSPLPERKRRIERLNHGHLAAALAGRATEASCPAQASTDAREAYLCGQMISIQHRPRRIADLHAELTAGAEKLAESCFLPGAFTEVAHDAIAIIGMGCVFPGAGDTGQYWENIIHGVNTIREVPTDRWDPDVYYDADRDIPDKTYSKIGAFIEGFEKDPLKFRIPPVSADAIDRVQFLMLEVVHQALQDAGYLERDFPRKRTGVFVGNAGGGNLRTSYGLRVYWGRFAQGSLGLAIKWAYCPPKSRIIILLEC